MKSLKTRFAAAFGAAAMMLSVPVTASAGGLDDLLELDLSNVNVLLANITGLCTKLLVSVPIDQDKIIVEDVADVLSVEDVADIDNTLNNLFVKVQLVNLHNVLNNANIANGNEIIKGGTWFSGNDINVDHVIGGDLLNTGDLYLLTCSSCCED